MAKTKFDFISELLANEKLAFPLKERLFALAIEEFKKKGSEDDLIWKEIEELKKGLQSAIFQEKIIEASPDQSLSSQFIPKHKPKDVADFMTLFNKREGLKYLTHDFDEEGEFNIKQYLHNSNRIFNKNAFEIYSIPRSLFSIIRQFAFVSEPEWTSVNKQKIRSGWSTPEWIEWSTKNKLHPIRNENFRTIINEFRKLTRIESPNLENIILNNIELIFGKDYGDYNIKLESLAKADFYTHIPSFEKAIYSILELIKLRQNHKNIEIKYERSTNNDYFIRTLIFNHLESFPTKDLDVLVSEWKSDKGAMGGIRNNLFGYCNWSVETKIDDEEVRVNILKDEATPDIEKLNNIKIDGFKHILTFYYR